MFIPSVLLSLCLTAPDAAAATVTTLELTDPVGIGLPSWDWFLIRTTTSGSTPVSGVTAEVESDAGSEEVTFTESDTSLHGSAALSDLPGTDSRITLTLYDTASASLMSFSGTLGADGSVSVTADEPVCEEGGRVSCTALTNPDIEVLAAEVFVGAAGGYDVTFDLHGADAYDVAYADIVVTESTEVTMCEKGGACTTTGSTKTTEAEVAWDSIGAVWEGELTLAHEGVIEVKAKTLDSRGKKIETVKSKLGAPWLDGGAGMNALATDEDPLTSVAFRTLNVDEHKDNSLVGSSGDFEIVSEGWTPSTVPVSAQVELTGGKTITIAANSYQKAAAPVKINHPFENVVISHQLTVNGGVFSLDGSSQLTDEDLASPLCADGVCVVLHPAADGEVELSVSAYATAATGLPTIADVEVINFDADGVELNSLAETVTFEDDVTAIFANEVKFSADPLGVDVSGKVSLLGAADKKGKQKTLAKGKFYGTFSRDADGDVALAGADKDLVSPSGTLVTTGTSIALSDADKDGHVDGPPVAVAKPASGGPTTTEKHGDILIDGVKIDYD